MSGTQEITNPLRAIEFMSLRNQVVKALRDSIITGAIPQGSSLVETRLAAQLNVSRGTVREALLELQREQLVENNSQERLCVRTISSRNVNELFTVRATLEGLAARLIVNSPARKAHQDTLRKHLSTLELYRNGPIADLIDVDLKFHRLLCELSGNEVLLNSWVSLEGMLRMAIMHAGAERARANISEVAHLPFLEALDEGSTDPAAIIFRSLMETVETLVEASQKEIPLEDE